MEFECLPQPETLSPALASLEAELFSQGKYTIGNAQQQIFCCKANNQYSEIQQVAEEVMHLIRDKGCLLYTSRCV